MCLHTHTCSLVTLPICQQLFISKLHILALVIWSIPCLLGSLLGLAFG